MKPKETKIMWLFYILGAIGAYVHYRDTFNKPCSIFLAVMWPAAIIHDGLTIQESQLDE